MKPNPDVIEFLARWLAYAKAGHVQDLFMLARMSDGEYVDGYEVDGNFDDMVLELRTCVIKMQCESNQDKALS